MKLKYKAEVDAKVNAEDFYADLQNYIIDNCDYDFVTMYIADLISYVKHKYNGKIEIEVCYDNN